jgi:hypothetical protein
MLVDTGIYRFIAESLTFHNENACTIPQAIND